MMIRFISLLNLTFLPTTFGVYLTEQSFQIIKRVFYLDKFEPDYQLHKDNIFKIIIKWELKGCNSLLHLSKNGKKSRFCSIIKFPKIMGLHFYFIPFQSISFHYVLIHYISFSTTNPNITLVKSHLIKDISKRMFTISFLDKNNIRKI